MAGPAQGLFPETNNIDHSVPQASSGETINHSSLSLDSKEHDFNESDSINSSVLGKIIEEEGNLYGSDIREKLGSNRFFLSQLYNSKTGRKTDDKEVTDFIKYNERMEQEYKLREKLEKIIKKSNDKSDLHILNSTLLLENFVGGEDNAATNSKYDSVKNAFTWIKKPLRSKRRPHRSHIEYSGLGRVVSNSGDTQIIDLDKHGEWPIDDQMMNNGGKRTLEAWLSVSRNSEQGIARKKPLRLLSEVFSPRGNNYSIQRKLEARHIQMIASGASFGVGLFLTSGKAFSVAGPFGTLIGFTLCATIVMATTISFTELCALIPLTSGFSGLASRFVEDAFGFALGWLYWFSFIIAVPSQVVASTSLIRYYQNLHMNSSKTAGFVTLLLSFAIIVNICDVRFFGNLVYSVTLLKIIFTVMMLFVLIVLNSGGPSLGYDRVGFRFWDVHKSRPNLTYGLFRPTFDLKDEGSGALNGIPGARGRVLAIFLSMSIASFTYSGIEMTFVASCEVKNPKKTLPSAMKRTLYTMLILYVLSILIVGLNVYAGDPRLPRFYTYNENTSHHNIFSEIGTTWQVSNNCPIATYDSNFDISDGNRSAWVIALRSFGQCAFASVLNGILIFFGGTSACSSLYGASRTLHSMALQEKAPRIFQTCTSYGVPWVAVLFSALFGIMSFMAVDQTSLNNFQILANIASATICIIWAGMNVSFLRFFYALKRRPDIISREDMMFPYKSPFQPYLSYYGLLGSLLMVFFAGFTSFFHGFWSTEIFFSCYGGLIFFIVAYLGYKIIGTSKIQRLDQVDMDIGRIEMDRNIWNDHREYQGNWKERLHNAITWFY